MKSKRELRVLLDTSFILPSLGVDVGREVLRGLEKLAETNAQVFYSRFTILESMWVVARHMGSEVDAAFTAGLRSVLESGRYQRVEEDAWVFGEALKLYALGHRDMIDNILYASTLRYNLRLLTLDRELREFIERKSLKNTLITPSELQQLQS